jgi:hypothetical protein
MRGRRPSPLDDSGAWWTGPEASKLPLSSAMQRPDPEEFGRIPRASPAGAISSPPDQHADVAELVDAHGSGPCLGNQVEVRVLSSALNRSLVIAIRRRQHSWVANGGATVTVGRFQTSAR